MVASTPSPAQEPAPVHDILVLKADEAWEDKTQKAIHFSGSVEVRASNWSLSSDSATLFGDLDDPDRIVAEGGPARIRFEHEDAEPHHAFQGQGRVIVYRRDSERVSIRGDALLRRDHNIMRSDRIEYERIGETFSAGGESGVSLTFTPDTD